MANTPDPKFQEMGLVNQEVYGSYFSTPGNGDGALDDMTTYTFSLCEFCLDWLFTRFVTPPKVNPYTFASSPFTALQGFGSHIEIDLDTTEEWRPAEQRVREDEWRRKKDEYFKEATRRGAKRNDGYTKIVENYINALENNDSLRSALATAENKAFEARLQALEDAAREHRLHQSWDGSGRAIRKLIDDEKKRT